MMSESDNPRSTKIMITIVTNVLFEENFAMHVCGVCGNNTLWEVQLLK